MLGLSIWKIAIIGGVVMVLFGRGKVSELMGDVAKGIKSFKKGMAEDEDLAPTVIEQQPAQTAAIAAQEAPRVTPA
jgi:sec-independent protein translocase protein TatA